MINCVEPTGSGLIPPSSNSNSLVVFEHDFPAGPGGPGGPCLPTLMFMVIGDACTYIEGRIFVPKSIAIIPDAANTAVIA